MMSRKIKLLLTIPNFDTAGSGKVLYDLAKGLDKNKFDVEIACESDKGEFFKLVEDLNLKIHLVETKTSYRPYSTIIARILRITNFYRENGFDIIHSWQWSSDWTEGLAAKFAGVKWLYTKKAMGFKSKHWKIKSHLADFIITINDEMKNYFPNKKQQRTINLGLDASYYNPELFNHELPDFFNIIVVANLVRVKGIETLLGALRKLEAINIKLTIVGDGSEDYMTFLKQLIADYNLTQKVNFVGKVLDVRPYLASSDLFVIPTLDQGRREGLPMALVEAMSMGLPVLGSDVSGINYVLKDFPDLLFKARCVDLLAQKIEEIKAMSRGERKQLGQQLRNYSKENFSLFTFIKSHQQLYSDLLGINIAHHNV